MTTPQTSDLLIGVRLKIERAKQHIDELGREVRVFLTPARISSLVRSIRKQEMSCTALLPATNPSSLGNHAR